MPLTRTLGISLKQADVSHNCYVLYRCPSGKGQGSAFLSGCFCSLYLLVMNDLWFGSLIRVSSQSPLRGVRASNAIDICGEVLGTAVLSFICCSLDHLDLFSLFFLVGYDTELWSNVSYKRSVRVIVGAITEVLKG